jgi:hypothetical protein
MKREGLRGREREGCGDQERKRKREIEREEIDREGKITRQTCVRGGKLIEGKAERNDNLSCISPSA